MIFKMTNLEHQYLIEANFIDEPLKEIIRNGQKQNSFINIQIEEDSLITLYEKLEDQLMYAGFDAEYKITDEGRILEALMDKITDLDS